ncbi:spore germination protein [Fictibacillus sp. 5RED26]|uniref:spore germination protein n=1 Tax=Fictibacillus TaxID=1329200 RepID=UPI0018CFD36F|nr:MULTISPECIES: spore germination protein [unclassified Fictibacillus]MBH0156903.1 spore germination protein [Fictibacillus sp. 5RED26]MBH0163979.1 spore germination protein [Fictibacillus sp. 7GRE50]MBH0173900.1 spore germination protein [Fictibacillus sp. 23RED33]
MFWKRKNIWIGSQNENRTKKMTTNIPIAIDVLRERIDNMEDAEVIEYQTQNNKIFVLIFIGTLIDKARLNEAVIEPLRLCKYENISTCISVSKITEITTLEEAEKKLMLGAILLFDTIENQWCSVDLKDPTGRAIETSETETILYGAKDSFSENLEQNITLIRRRLPLTALKSEKFTVGSLTETKVVLMYIEGLTNPDFISIAREKIKSIDYDQILDSSQLAAFMEDHKHSVFPQFQHTDRPDVCAYSLGVGKVTILVDNTPFALNAPINFFHLFQSPEDYINRWIVASFLRIIRYLSFMLSLLMIPLYVALTTHHYQMIPLQILFVLVETRSQLPLTPFWESLIMLITLEVIKEASLRMPTKSGQTLGVIGGIVVGQAAVEAGFASQVLIVLVGISAIASFLVPNYLMTKATTLIQFTLLILASFLGVMGIFMGIILLLVNLNALTSLKQPYFTPVAPFYGKDWLDLFIRGPLHWMKTRPEALHPLQKWRYSRRR